jgi:hypothetical protein
VVFTFAMKRSNLIFTHSAVFAVGLVAASISGHFRGGNDQAGQEAVNKNSQFENRAERSANRESADGSKDASRESRVSSQKKQGTPSERLADIVKIADPVDRQRALLDLIDQLAPSEFANIADQFRELDHLDDSRGEYALILSRWAKQNPLEALQYVNAHSNSKQGRSTVLAAWAQQEPAAAERWALENHKGTGPNPHLAAVIRGVAATDLAHATQLTEGMPRSRERGEAIDAITRALLAQGIDAAMAFPNTIKDEALRGSYVAAMAGRLISKDLNKTAEWLADMPDGMVQNRAAAGVAAALGKTDLTKATAWINRLKPEARAEAALGIIPIMAQNDIPGTARWLTTLAGTPGYDAAVERFVWSCDSRAPEQSAAWIQGVSDPNQQRRLFFRMLGGWSRRDPVAVKQWVASNKVPADVLRRFLQP